MNKEPNSSIGETTQIDVYQARGKEANEAKMEIERLEQELREIEEKEARLDEEEKKIRQRNEYAKKTIEGYKRYMNERESEPTPIIGQVAPEKADAAEKEATKEKAKKKRRLRGLIAGLAALAAVSAIAFVGLHLKNKNRNNVPQEQPGITTMADTSEQSSEDDEPDKIPVNIDDEASAEDADPFAGELANGTHYDYSHYGDRQMVFDEDGNVTFDTKKEAWNAYDYDMSDAYGDRDATIAKIMDVANKAPEALASYAYSIFNDAEKAELGISGMSMTEIDDYISNHENGGEMQAKLLAKLEQVLNDNTTRFSFYLENDTEDTNYIYFVDDNENGKMDPTELHLGFDTRERNNAPQVDILRGEYDHSDKEGDYYNWKKVLDLNYKCGMQPNYEKDKTPDDVPYVPSDPTPTPTPEPEPTPTPTPEPEPEPTPTPTPEPEPTPTPTPEPEPEPTPTPEPEPEPTPEETLAPKDKENMERIDKQIEEDIKENIDTGDIVIEKGEATEDNKTEKPSPDVYQGTGAQTVVNEAAQPTDETTPPPVQVRQEQPGESQSEQRVNVVSSENNHTENRGGANSNEYAPVQENQAAQEEANEAETPVAEAPGVDALQRAAQIAAEQRAAEASAASTEASTTTPLETTTTPPETSTVAPNETSNDELDMQAEELLEYLRGLGIE